jgi:hypothetical protein
VLHAGLRAWVRVISGNLDAGRTTHGYLAWAAAVAVPAVLAMVVHHLLWQLHPVLAYLWNVGLLYLTLGFRQFSHHFTEIRDALAQGDEDAARTELARWLSIEAIPSMWTGPRCRRIAASVWWLQESSSRTTSEPSWPPRHSATCSSTTRLLSRSTPTCRARSVACTGVSVICSTVTATKIEGIAELREHRGEEFVRALMGQRSD